MTSDRNTGSEARGQEYLPGVEKAIEREHRKRRIFLVVFLVVLSIPIISAVVFALYGRSDVEVIRSAAKDEVKETIGASGPALREVGQALPEILGAAELAKSVEQGLQDERFRVEGIVEELRSEQQKLGRDVLETKRELEPVKQKAKELERTTEAVGAAIQALKVNPGMVDEQVKKAVAEMRREFAKTTDMLNVELQKTRDAAQASKLATEQLGADLLKARAEIKRLETRLPNRPPLGGKFDPEKWKIEVQKRMRLSIQPNEPNRSKVLGELRKALSNHGPFSEGGKSTEEALQELDRKTRGMLTPP